MNSNYQKARYQMVENQLRPNKIEDPEILDIFKNTKKEEFISKKEKEISYSDIDIEVDENRGYLKNLHIAQLIFYSELKKNYKVLHIGGLTGYVTVMLSKLCKKIIVLENNPDLFKKLENNIKKLNIKNLKAINCSYNDGYIDDSPYDLIFIDNPVYKISAKIKNQLNSQSGKIIMIKKFNNFLSKAYKITKNEDNYSKQFLFDVFTSYELLKKKDEFIF